MLKWKRSMDQYFGLDEVAAGDQWLYYGTLGVMVIIMISGTIGGLL